MAEQSRHWCGIIRTGDGKMGLIVRWVYLARRQARFSRKTFFIPVVSRAEILRRLRRLRKFMGRYDSLRERRFPERERITWTAARPRRISHCFAARQKTRFCGTAPNTGCAKSAQTGAVLERLAGVLGHAKPRRRRDSGARKRKLALFMADAAHLPLHQIYAPGGSVLMVPPRVRGRLSRRLAEHPPACCTLQTPSNIETVSFNILSTDWAKTFPDFPLCWTNPAECRRCVSPGQTERSGLTGERFAEKVRTANGRPPYGETGRRPRQFCGPRGPIWPAVRRLPPRNAGGTYRT